MVILALVAMAISILSFLNDIRDPSGEQPNSLAAIGIIAMLFLYALVFFRIYDYIDVKRKSIGKGRYRDFYAVQDDFSFQLLFLSGLGGLSDIPDTLLCDIFMDRDVIESDRRIRRLGSENHEELRFTRQEQKRVLNLIQGFYLRAGAATHEILNEFQQIHITIDAMTNHLASDLLDTHNDHRESLMELIKETQVQA